MDISETRKNYVADMLFIRASNRQLKKDALQWSKILEKQQNKKESRSMSIKQKQKYTKNAFKEKLKSMKGIQ